MKKTIFACLCLAPCLFAQEWDEFIPGVYQFRGRANTEKFVVAHWFEDTENRTTAVENPAQNAYWAVSHGGLLSHPLLDLMAAGVSWEFHGRQETVLNPNGNDPKRFLPTYVYRLFTHSSENYDSILRSSASFINILPMEISEIATNNLLRHIETALHDSLAVNVKFARSVRRVQILEYLTSFDASLDSVEVVSAPNPTDPFAPPASVELVYFVRTNIGNVLPMIHSGFFTELSLRSVIANDQNSISKNPRLRTNSAASFAGIRNGRILLNLHAGNYNVRLYNLQGRLINQVEINAVNGINSIDLRADNLGAGVFVLNVRRGEVSLLRQRIRMSANR